ncbi:MAG: hypothetical protein B1H04_02800 [Planctomycetales bacterium 4484_123]|nr:MAG: hypothetical protein B1H04_02800 [Planctomycetales bacterium 4484_123]
MGNMGEQTKTTDAPPTPGQDSQPEEKLVVVRYGRMGHIAVLPHHLDPPPASGTALVVRTQRGTELARVLINVGTGPAREFIPRAALENYIQANGAEYPVNRTGKVLRQANPQDLNDQHHLDRATADKSAFCREQIRQLNLEMRLVAVEHLLGGERIVFYFTAERRVDFRELVRRLAGRYHTRIEMRQVGARDEARLVADYERCGMRCCCQSFLKFLQPISMRMAKTQKATLDPTKISGRCGRLMCCLRYEDATYEELLSRLPKKNTWVRTAEGVVGRVIDSQILAQLVRLVLPDNSHLVVANEDIVERGLPAPPPPEQPPSTRPEAQVRESPTPPTSPRPAPAELDEVLERIGLPEDEAASQQASSPKGRKSTRRRRGRRKKKPASAQAARPAQAAEARNQPAAGRPSKQAEPQQPKQAKRRKRRPRRRKKKRPQDRGPQAGQSGNPQ